MLRLWTNFAKTGDPNVPEPGPVSWSPLTAESQSFLDLGPMEMTMVMVEVKMINRPLMVSRRHCFVCGKTKRVVLAQLGGELLHWTPHCVIRRA